jgi:peptide/nickel transport system substrate-binding protein
MKRRQFLSGAAFAAAAPALLGSKDVFAQAAQPQPLRAGTVRVAILQEMVNFDPMQFSTNNFPLIKNLYDSLIEYTPEGRAVPSLATAWQIAPDSKSVSVTLRQGVKFHAGGTLDAEAVAATLRKANDPQAGRNVYPTMSIVKDWTVANAQTIQLNFKDPVPERQITDLLQFLSVIDPAGIATVDTRAAGTGPYTVAERVVGQRVRMVKNPNYWRQNEPLSNELVLTLFSDDASASAALESGAVDIVYGGTARSAARLRAAGFQLLQGPGPLVQVFRINSTRGPFRNAKFRQAFNFLMDRAGILRVGYAGLGEVTALPWAPASPAVDAAYNTRFAYNIDKAKDLLRESGLSAAEQSDWQLFTNGGDEVSVTISQIVQSSLRQAGINIQLDVKQGAEFVDGMLQGRFAATFGGIGNIQKFPTRVTTNSIYRTSNNPILGEPHPFPEYVAAIDRVNRTFGSGADVRAAYDNLNRVLVESAFAIPTNSYDIGLIVAARNVGGFLLDIDNMLVVRNIGFRG